MRLSDEDVSEAREAALLRMAQGHRDDGEPVTRVTRDLLAAYCEQMAALVAEVRALRECEQFAENMAEHDCAYGDNCPTFGSRHGRCTGCAARAALAAVRALEDKP